MKRAIVFSVCPLISVHGMPVNLDGIVLGWLDTMAKHGNGGTNSGGGGGNTVMEVVHTSLEGIVVGLGVDCMLRVCL